MDCKRRREGNDPFCASKNIALTPYSALAGDRLAKHKGKTSKRLEEDVYAKFKYDKTAQMDQIIIDRMAEMTEKYQVSMTEVSLAWLLTKVASPVVGATKLHQVMVRAVDLKLADEDIKYLEEMYLPHALVGVMAQNGK